MPLRPLVILAICAAALWLPAAPCPAAETSAGAPGPDALYAPPEAGLLAVRQPGLEWLKVTLVGPDGARLQELTVQVAAGYWGSATCTTETEALASILIATGPPNPVNQDPPPLILADWYRVPMPSAVGRVYIWPCVPGARYCVWVGQRRFSGRVCLNPRARRLGDMP